MQNIHDVYNINILNTVPNRDEIKVRWVRPSYTSAKNSAIKMLRPSLLVQPRSYSQQLQDCLLFHMDTIKTD